MFLETLGVSIIDRSRTSSKKILKICFSQTVSQVTALNNNYYIDSGSEKKSNDTVNINFATMLQFFASMYSGCIRDSLNV